MTESSREPYVALRPYNSDVVADLGDRLRVEVTIHEPDLVIVALETVLPERVLRPDAVRREIHESLPLAMDDARWLHARLGEACSDPLVTAVRAYFAAWDAVQRAGNDSQDSHEAYVALRACREALRGMVTP